VSTKRRLLVLSADKAELPQRYCPAARTLAAGCRLNRRRRASVSNQKHTTSTAPKREALTMTPVGAGCSAGAL